MFREEPVINRSHLLLICFLGYQVGRPVIGGVLDDATGAVGRAPISLWQGGNIAMVNKMALQFIYSICSSL